MQTFCKLLVCLFFTETVQICTIFIVILMQYKKQVHFIFFFKEIKVCTIVGTFNGIVDNWINRLNGSNLFRLTVFYLNNKRACPQKMFKILRLRKQCCQIKRITGLPKTWGHERELKIKIMGRAGGGGGHLQRTGRHI